jgi:putative sterol carrier protein
MHEVKEVFAKISEKFHDKAPQGLDAVFQFEITGEGGGEWHVLARDGKCLVQAGRHAAPDVTLRTSAETFLALANGEVSGMQAFLTGTLKVEGNLLLAQRLPELMAS